MKITATYQEISDAGSWEVYCEMMGIKLDSINCPYICKTEDSFTEEEANELGLINTPKSACGLDVFELHQCTNDYGSDIEFYSSGKWNVSGLTKMQIFNIILQSPDKLKLYRRKRD